MTTSVEIAEFKHTPYYCEENVYLLCNKLIQTGTEAPDLFVLFISNQHKQIPLWHQKASHRADGLILWDYHVICIQRKRENNSSDLVWDLDSSLPFPSPLPTYVAETIRPSFPLFSDYQRVFRIVHAPIFLRNFASDRRHMKDSAGNWTAQPPDYEPFVAEDGSINNLNEYMEIKASDGLLSVEGDASRLVLSERLGVVINENQLEEYFSHLSRLH